MPRTKEQFEEMRLKSRSIIIETALSLFISKGYHTTTISNIAKEAGVAVGLMYNYFSSKEELLVSIIDEHFQKLFIAIKQEIGGTPVSADIRKMIDTMFAVVIKRNDSWKLIISVMFQPDVSKIARKRIEDFSLNQQEIYEKYFIAKGVNKPEESAKALSVIIHSAFLNYAYSEKDDELQLIRSTIIEKLLEEGV